ncbi:MAG: NAD(P)H-hydrate epimerase [Acidimicrobiia bacterium]
MSWSFTTDRGVVVPTVTVEQMREVDRIAVERRTPNIYQMMENAGRALAAAATAVIGEGWTGIPITVFGGPGGNGGGGTAAARHLANRGGDVTLILAREPTPGTILDQQLEIYSETPGRLGAMPEDQPGLILDALIGYGLNEAPQGLVAEMISAINEAGVPVISLDVPSGRDADTGQAPGVVVAPTETLTLALPKQGLEGSDVGDVWLADLGVPAGVFRRVGVEPSPRIFEGGSIVHLSRTSP